MVTYNALSIPNYHKLIKGVYDLKTEYGSTDRYWNSATFLDTSYLRHPKHQTVQVLQGEKNWSDKIFQDAQYCDFLGVPLFEKEYIGYSDVEIQKIKRTHDWMISPIDEKALITQRRNFGYYFKAHDERRGTDFCKTFPELADFYNNCLEIKL